MILFGWHFRKPCACLTCQTHSEPFKLVYMPHAILPFISFITPEPTENQFSNEPHQNPLCLIFTFYSTNYLVIIFRRELNGGLSVATIPNSREFHCWRSGHFPSPANVAYNAHCRRGWGGGWGEMPHRRTNTREYNKYARAFHSTRASPGT